MIIHIAGSIKIAESSKIIENVQRDINIALINEFSNFFLINVPFRCSVTKTKWNFIDFRPGIVEDIVLEVAQYLTHIAKINKHNPKTYFKRKISVIKCISTLLKEFKLCKKVI